MDGTLLSSFQSQTSYNGSLALDPADNTLWLFDRDGSKTFYQYSKSGQLLSTQYYSSIASYNILGGEFQVNVPELSSFAFIFLGVAGLGMAKKFFAKTSTSI